MKEGMILTARVNNIETIKFVGTVRYSHCAGLESHIDRIFSQPNPCEVVIDLEQAIILDSTALGLLAKVAIEYRKFSQMKPIVFVNEGELHLILKRVCFDQVFNLIIDQKEKTCDEFIELLALPQDENEILESVVKAHRNLTALSEQNSPVYIDITGSM